MIMLSIEKADLCNKCTCLQFIVQISSGADFAKIRILVLDRSTKSALGFRESARLLKLVVFTMLRFPARPSTRVGSIPTKTGSHQLACSRLFGAGHHNMKHRSRLSLRRTSGIMRRLPPQPTMPLQAMRRRKVSSK
jgi:hypothetical protein